MEDIIRHTISDGHLIPAGARVLVAVSGGADSTALLYALCRLAPQIGCNIVAAHVNHRIRPSAAADAAAVARLCSWLGVAAVFCAENVPEYAKVNKIGLEEAGRQVRYRFLRIAAQCTDSTRIATAHHLNDQAETLVMRLARGTSAPGLRGIPLINLPFIRPMLRVERSQVEEYLVRHGVPHVEDESNADSRFTRNRVRHKVLPLLEEVHPQAQRHLAHLAQQVSVEEDYWTEQVDSYLHSAEVRADETRILYHETAALHPALRIRVMRALLGRVRGNLYGLESVHLHTLESMFSHPGPQVQFDLPGAWVARRYGNIVCRRSAPETEDAEFCVCADSPGMYFLPGGATLEIVAMSKRSDEGRLCIELDAAALQWPLYIRDNRPGDRLKCVGMNGSKRLKRIFSERRLEQEQRSHIPVLCDGDGELLWVLGVRRSCLAPCDESTARVVRILFSPSRRKI